MSTYLGQPLGYKSADTQTDRQKIPPKIVLKIFNLRGWHICAIWHPDFLWNRCVSLNIGKTKIQFLEKIWPCGEAYLLPRRTRIFYIFFFVFSNCKADTSLPCGILTFSETDVPASKLEKPKTHFWEHVCLFVFLSKSKLIPQEFSKNWSGIWLFLKSIPKDLLRNSNDSQLMSKGFGKALIDFLMIWQSFD